LRIVFFLLEFFFLSPTWLPAYASRLCGTFLDILAGGSQLLYQLSHVSLFIGFIADVAQLVEQLFRKERVGGSIPLVGLFKVLFL
jgi:hypothetical protein